MRSEDAREELRLDVWRRIPKYYPSTNELRKRLDTRYPCDIETEVKRPRKNERIAY